MQSLFLWVFPPIMIYGQQAAVMRPIARLVRQGTEERREDDEVMLLKSCRCGRIIPQSMRMCEVCEKSHQTRHVVYNNTRRDKRTAAFYVSKEWRALRPVIMNVYGYVDIYALYVQKEIKTINESDPVHHIIELDEDWNQRLNPLNLIPLKHDTHTTITALYKNSKESMRETQKQLRKLIEIHFKEAGGYEKVLANALQVAPPFSSEKTPHGNF